MAWSTGNFFIAPGATVIIWFKWDPGIDQGPQWAMAHPFPGETESWLVTERVGKKLICEVGVVEINGEARYRCGGTAYYEYRAWITNDGPSGCRFELQGGGV